MLRSILIVLTLSCTLAQSNVIQYRVNQLEVGLEDAVHELEKRDEELEEKLEGSVEELKTQIEQLEEALGVSVIALDQKDKEMADTLDNLLEAVQSVKRLEVELRERLDNMQTQEKAATAKDLIPASNMKSPASNGKSAPKYMQLVKLPELPSFVPSGGCKAYEGKVVSSRSSSWLKGSTGAEKATDGRPHTAMLTMLEPNPWYKAYLNRPGLFDSITIRGFHHYNGSIFSVYVIDSTGGQVKETKCDYSYTPYNKGDYVQTVKCNRVRGTGFKVSVANRSKGEVNLLIKDVKVTLCQG